MNCKQGDLAVVVWSHAGNEGRIVKCLRLVTTREAEMEWLHQSMLPAWHVDCEMNALAFGGFVRSTSRIAADCQLRPIRDNDGEDESLQWAGKPQRVMEECDVQG